MPSTRRGGTVNTSDSTKYVRGMVECTVVIPSDISTRLINSMHSRMNVSRDCALLYNAIQVHGN